jgi:hypothetical protein
MKEKLNFIEDSDWNESNNLIETFRNSKELNRSIINKTYAELVKFPRATLQTNNIRCMLSVMGMYDLRASDETIVQYVNRNENGRLWETICKEHLIDSSSTARLTSIKKEQDKIIPQITLEDSDDDDDDDDDESDNFNLAQSQPVKQEGINNENDLNDLNDDYTDQEIRDEANIEINQHNENINQSTSHSDIAPLIREKICRIDSRLHAYRDLVTEEYDTVKQIYDRQCHAHGTNSKPKTKKLRHCLAEIQNDKSVVMEYIRHEINKIERSDPENAPIASRLRNNLTIIQNDAKHKFETNRLNHEFYKNGTRFPTNVHDSWIRIRPFIKYYFSNDQDQTRAIKRANFMTTRKRQKKIL